MSKLTLKDCTNDELIYIIRHTMSSQDPIDMVYEKRMNDIEKQWSKIHSKAKILIDQMEQAAKNKDAILFFKINDKLTKINKKEEQISNQYSRYSDERFGR